MRFEGKLVGIAEIYLAGGVLACLFPHDAIEEEGVDCDVEKTSDTLFPEG